MKYLFVIQGEGRGHFTQALTLKSMLERNGHEVVSVMVGASPRRKLPAFFTEKINTEIERFQSPNFLPSPKGKKSFVLISLLYNLLLLPVYFASILQIRSGIRRHKPDVVINFYEILCGISYGLMPPKTPMVNIAHQYYFLTPEFNYSGSHKTAFFFLRFYTRITAWNATKILALSFRRSTVNNYGAISIVPPLLRREIMQLTPSTGNYIHGYMLNSGYAREIAKWSEYNLYEHLHFFWDKKEADKVTKLTPNLTLHTLNDVLFMEYMAGCKAYATTAGFESVCEAMYLMKPIIMIPTHIEQECNAMDAMESGAGISSDRFQLDQLLDYLPQHRKTAEFRYWANTAEQKIIDELVSVENSTESNVFAIL